LNGPDLSVATGGWRAPRTCRPARRRMCASPFVILPVRWHVRLDPACQSVSGSGIRGRRAPPVEMALELGRCGAAAKFSDRRSGRCRQGVKLRSTLVSRLLETGRNAAHDGALLWQYEAPFGIVIQSVHAHLPPLNLACLPKPSRSRSHGVFRRRRISPLL
jgi:hypothetical protein